MRKSLYAFPVLLGLLGLVLPVWGETPAAPAVPSPLAGSSCLAAASSGIASLPDVVPAPELRTVTCGACLDCFGSSPGGSCVDSSGSPGVCFGLRNGTNNLFCPGTHLYQCVCLSFE